MTLTRLICSKCLHNWAWFSIPKDGVSLLQLEFNPEVANVKCEDDHVTDRGKRADDEASNSGRFQEAEGVLQGRDWVPPTPRRDKCDDLENQENSSGDQDDASFLLDKYIIRN